MYKHTLKELVELEEIQNIMKKFYDILKISYSIFDTEGNLIISIGENGIYKNKEQLNYNVKHSKKDYFFINNKDGTKTVLSSIRVKDQTIGYIAIESFFTKDKEYIKDMLNYQKYMIEFAINKNVAKLSYEEKAYEKFKDKFFANLSHEFRTPLTVILSSIYMCKDSLDKEDTLDMKISQYLNHIKKNTYRLLRLTNNLIDMTKIDCGELILFKQNNDIVSIVEDTTLRVAQYIHSKNIEVTFDTDVEEKIIACDKEKIQRVMLNLLSNAVKFTPNGGKILVRVRNNNGFIRISVKDTGIGIPEKEKDLIFEPFTQVNNGLSRIAEGSGIGLPIIKSLVEMHKGAIWVESTCGKGSEFFIELPDKTLKENNNNYKKIEFYGIEENTNIEFSDIYF